MSSGEVPDGWVRLNVGRKIFVTMKQTLRASPFFTRLFETDDRMPDAKAGSPTHFVDRDPHCFSKVLNFLRNGTFFADKNSNFGELRLEVDFYGLEDLVTLIDEMKAQNELRNTLKCVVVSRKCTKVNMSDSKRLEIAINPRDDDHFLLHHLQKHYPCRVSAPSFQFPHGFTFDVTACNNCQKWKGPSYAYRCYAHSCGCARDVADDMLRDIVSVLEAHGYVLDRSVETAITAAGNTPTSWTFVKREG